MGAKEREFDLTVQPIFRNILPTKKFMVMIKYFNPNYTRKREKGGARAEMRKEFDLTVLPSFWNISSRSQAKTC